MLVACTVFLSCTADSTSWRNAQLIAGLMEAGCTEANAALSNSPEYFMDSETSSENRAVQDPCRVPGILDHGASQQSWKASRRADAPAAVASRRG